MQRLITIREACDLTSMSRTAIWRKTKDGDFPRPISLGDGARKAFVFSELQDWIARRVAARDGETAA